MEWKDGILFSFFNQACSRLNAEVLVTMAILLNRVMLIIAVRIVYCTKERQKCKFHHSVVARRVTQKLVVANQPDKST